MSQQPDPRGHRGNHDQPDLLEINDFLRSVENDPGSIEENEEEVDVVANVDAILADAQPIIEAASEDPLPAGELARVMIPSREENAIDLGDLTDAEINAAIQRESQRVHPKDAQMIIQNTNDETIDIEDIVMDAMNAVDQHVQTMDVLPRQPGNAGFVDPSIVPAELIDEAGIEDDIDEFDDNGVVITEDIENGTIHSAMLSRRHHPVRRRLPAMNEHYWEPIQEFTSMHPDSIHPDQPNEASAMPSTPSITNQNEQVMALITSTKNGHEDDGIYFSYDINTFRSMGTQERENIAYIGKKMKERMKLSIPKSLNVMKEGISTLPCKLASQDGLLMTEWIDAPVIVLERTLDDANMYHVTNGLLSPVQKLDDYYDIMNSLISGSRVNCILVGFLDEITKEVILFDCLARDKSIASLPYSWRFKFLHDIASLIVNDSISIINFTDDPLKFATDRARDGSKFFMFDGKQIAAGNLPLIIPTTSIE